MSLLKNFATVGTGTAVSRVLGFVRDMFIAAALGAGPVAEAYFVAQRLPNLFRRLFAEGAFASAFVPLFTRRHQGEGAEEARRFAADPDKFDLTVLLSRIAFPYLFLISLATLLSGALNGVGRFAAAAFST